MISFIAGFLFFALDIFLLTLALRWLRNSASLTKSKLIALLLLGKFLFLGGGIYVSLVVFAAEILFFVGGALLFLLILIGWALRTATS